MKFQDAQALAELVLEEHGLDKQGWTFEWDYAKRRAGQCRYGDKVISLSFSYSNLNDEANVENTIRHEVAHALVGPGHGHGPVWQRMALKIGCNASRTTTPDTVKPKGKYTATCPSCAKEVQYYARPRVQKSCGSCCSVWNPAFLMKVTKNR